MLHLESTRAPRRVSTCVCGFPVQYAARVNRLERTRTKKNQVSPQAQTAQLQTATPSRIQGRIHTATRNCYTQQREVTRGRLYYGAPPNTTELHPNHHWYWLVLVQLISNQYNRTRTRNIETRKFTSKLGLYNDRTGTVGPTFRLRPSCLPSMARRSLSYIAPRDQHIGSITTRAHAEAPA